LALAATLVCVVDARRGARQQTLQEPEQRFRALTELACDWWWEQDSAYRFTFIGGNFEAISGQSAASLLGKTRWELPCANLGEADWAAHRALLDRRETFRDFEVSRPDAQGRLMHYALSGQPVFDARQQFVGYRGVGNNITSRREAEEATRHLAHFDPLTDLPNRSLFPDRVQTEILRAQRNNRKVALLMLDLDHFKQINDTLGHDQGDGLLVMAAQRLRDCVRGADTVARVGGDEFMVILGDLEDLRPVETIAGNVLQSLSQPYPLTGGSGIVSASIGIAVYPDDATDVAGLVKRADQSMYAAKTAGRNRFSFFTKELQDQAESRIWLTQDIRSALRENQFWVAYQPIHSFSDGSVHKAEALIRWQHPERGLVEPSVFVPVAESTGLISEISQWVFYTVAAQAQAWRASYHRDFQVSINKSPVQFYRPGGDEVTWHQQLRELGLGERSIVVEIAESLLLNSNQSIAEQIRAIRSDGIQVSIDDFGSGASSLANLQAHHIDYLKIDQGFVRKLAAGSDALALSQAIIAMAHKLGIQVIAQGVETQEQADLLRLAGCDYAQGYWFARPMDATSFDAYLRSNPRAA
jgi:diguanylate cyclase (GGDEF)-like protein/PAS domain S-box-containing protein